MVKVCSVTNYPSENEIKYKEYFDKFNYPLHIFQKWSIEGIVEGNHVLVTAPTGSGKSLPAEFALDYFHSKGKKTIYCSPIKSLSNQKFYDFSQKYPHISIGIITGDIKNNPDADVLIMTTEILLNKLYQIKSNSKNSNSFISFEMNIETELGCVIFDEIHMIADENRGSVWENSIMMLPRHIQMIGLSATLDNPSTFAYWLENRGEENTSGKIVYLTSKKIRAVPLTHYSFITVNQGIFKAIKDKSVQQEINNIINKPFILQDSSGKFDDEQFFKTTKMLKLFESKNITVKPSHALNQVTKYLTENEMTPAICYVFSIKKLELYAKDITTNLLEFDSKIPYTVKRESEQILRSKISNFEEYLNLPEYLNLVSLLEKGIATHHSKMLPILREIVEIFFSKGYIKLLFATESVAIGLNLPVKTCIFTDIYKHDGNTLRLLQGHEFVQAAGRAGRLGIDTVGHAIHLNNMFRNVDSTSYKTMMNGKPQSLISKFKISYHLLLNLIDINDIDLVNFSSRSMATTDIDNQSKQLYYKISELNTELDNIKNCSTNLKTPRNIIHEYLNIQKNSQYFSSKKRKEVDRNMKQMEDSYIHLKKDIQNYEIVSNKEKEICELEKQMEVLNSYFKIEVNKVLELLTDNGFIENNILTLKGQIACNLREIHCLVFSELLSNKCIEDLSTKQLISLFSCFTNIKVPDDIKHNVPRSTDKTVQDIILKVNDMYNDYQNKELKYNVNSGVEYNIHFELLNYVVKWCDCTNEGECKLLLIEISKEKGIFLGEFVKALLKINNISCEMEKVAEILCNVSFLNKLREIPQMTLKYVVTNQSLYI